jgi:hypothetical protein
MEALIDRLCVTLAETGLERAVLSHPETLAHLCLFDPAVEEWPVANPFVASPALRVLDGDDATRFHAAHAARNPVPVEQYRSYEYESAPAPKVELSDLGPTYGHHTGHVFVVRAGGNEILTRFEHTL